MMKVKGVQHVSFKSNGMFFSRIKIIVIFAVVAIIIICLMVYINTTIFNAIAAALTAIVVSIIISAIYNEELHKAMDKYDRIGLVNYFNNFEEAHSAIINKISKAKSVDIFVMYADSFINNSTIALQALLSKDNSRFRYFMFSSENKFIESYGNHWGVLDNNPKYNEEGLKLKIQNVKNDLKRLKDKKHQGSVFELYEIQSAPISYSFYKIDNELFFVPSKNIRSKEIKPAVFHFIKTRYNSSMYAKLESELQTMISNNEVIKFEL